MKTDQKISLRRHPSLWMGIALVSLIVLMGIVSFLYLPFDPTEVSEQRLSAPSATHIFGTDDFGRDVFSRMLSGAGICLLVLSLIHISEPTRLHKVSRMPSSA